VAESGKFSDYSYSTRGVCGQVIEIGGIHVWWAFGDDSEISLDNVSKNQGRGAWSTGRDKSFCLSQDNPGSISRRDSNLLISISGQ
jgi:hypothetical protein